MGLSLGLLLLLSQVCPPQTAQHVTFGPLENDPGAVAAHQRLFAKRSLMSLIERSGSDSRVSPRTSFVSHALAKRLAKCNWPTRSPSFKFAPNPQPEGARFDLAEAYAYCFIAHVDLAFPDVGDNRYTLRPWPAQKINRQFGRALTLAGNLTLDEKERLYYGLVRAGAIAQEWWYEIEMAITARGDVIGNSKEDADFALKWLIGVGADAVERDSVGSGVRARVIR